MARRPTQRRYTHSRTGTHTTFTRSALTQRTNTNRTNTDGTKQSFAVSYITDRQLPFSEIPPQPRPGGRRTERADCNKHPSYHAYNTNNPRHTLCCCHHPSLLGGDMVRCYSRDPAAGSTPGTVKEGKEFKGGFAFDIGCGWRQVSEFWASMSGIPRMNSKTTHLGQLAHACSD